MQSGVSRRACFTILCSSSSCKKAGQECPLKCSKSWYRIRFRRFKLRLLNSRAWLVINVKWVKVRGWLEVMLLHQPLFWLNRVTRQAGPRTAKERISRTSMICLWLQKRQLHSIHIAHSLTKLKTWWDKRTTTSKHLTWRISSRGTVIQVELSYRALRRKEKIESERFKWLVMTRTQMNRMDSQRSPPLSDQARRANLASRLTTSRIIPTSRRRNLEHYTLS